MTDFSTQFNTNVTVVKETLGSGDEDEDELMVERKITNNAKKKQFVLQRGVV